MTGTTPLPRRALVALVLYLAAFGTYTTLRRNANWDLVPYTALAREGEVDDPRALQELTYSDLRAELDAETYTEFIESEPYRAACATDARVFEEQLGFYRYRKLLPWALALLHRLGMAWSTAATLISVSAALATVALVAGWTWRVGASWTGLGVLALWIPASGLVDVARLWTPDTLGALLALLGLYLWLQRSSPATGALMMVVSILARSSNVVFVGALLVALALAPGRARERWIAGLAVLGAVAVYLSLGRLGNGWWPMFVHTCVERVPLPRSEPPAFQAEIYVRAVAAGAPYIHLTKAGLWAAVAALYAALPGAPLRERWMAGLLVVSAGAQFLAAPVLWDRLFVTQQLLVGVFWLGHLGAMRGGNAASPFAHPETT